jgi:hypothetical protein
MNSDNQHSDRDHHMENSPRICPEAAERVNKAQLRARTPRG